MTTDTIRALAARLGDWDPHKALLQLQAEEYQRDVLAEARSAALLEAAQTEYRQRMRAGSKRTDTHSGT